MRSNLSAIIDTACTKDPGVQAPPGHAHAPVRQQHIRNWVNSYNADLPGLVAQKQAAGDNIALVDMNTDFPANGLSGDNLHPNETGYAWMASQWQIALLAGGVSAAIPANSPTTVARAPSWTSMAAKRQSARSPAAAASRWEAAAC